MKDDIIRMAREAGFADGVAEIVGLAGFERLVELARADEREACAKVAEEGLIGHTIAKAIRARVSRPTTVIYSPGQLAERGLTHEDVVKLIKENT